MNIKNKVDKTASEEISEMNAGKKEKNKKAGKSINIKIKIRTIFILAIAVIVIIATVIKLKQEPKKEIVSEASLQKILNVGRLSTFETTYYGVAKVDNNKGKIQYYVSYEATIKAGFDFDQLTISVNQDNKSIVITIPKVDIDYNKDINVKPESFEYLFVNDKANDETVSAEASKACNQDIRYELDANHTIVNLAEKNSKRVVEALVKPFLEQLDEEFTLEIKMEGEQ